MNTETIMQKPTPAWAVGKEYTVTPYLLPISTFIPIVYPEVDPSIAITSTKILHGMRTMCDPRKSQGPPFKGEKEYATFRGQEILTYFFGKPSGQFETQQLFSESDTLIDPNDLLTKNLTENMKGYTPDIDIRYRFTPDVTQEKMYANAAHSLQSRGFEQTSDNEFTNNAVQATFENVVIAGKVFHKIHFSQDSKRIFSLDIGPETPWIPDQTHDYRFGSNRPPIDLVSTFDIYDHDSASYIGIDPTTSYYYRNLRSFDYYSRCGTLYSHAYTGLTRSYLLRIIRWPQAFNRHGETLAETVGKLYNNSLHYSDDDWWKGLTNPNNSPAELEILQQRKEGIITDAALLPFAINPFLHLEINKAAHTFSHLPVGKILTDPVAYAFIYNHMADQIGATDRTERGLWHTYKERVLHNPDRTIMTSGPILFMRALEEYSGTKSEYPLSDFVHLHDPLKLWK